jgi:hypothetical protein
MATRREALAANFDAAEKGDQAEVQSEPAAPQESAVSEAAPAVEKARDETGKFLPKDKNEPSKAAPEDKYAKPPKSWKQDFHTHYAELKPDVRAYLHQREEEQNKGVEPLKSQAQRAQIFEQALGPLGQELNARGVAIDAFLRDISQTVMTLSRGTPEQKQAVLGNIARTYGVQMAQQAAQAAQTGQTPPEIARLQAELQGIKGEFSRAQQMREQAEWQTVHNHLAEFEKDVEKYPHFSAVRVTMGKLIAAQSASGLEDAYSKAIRLHDDIWQQEQAKQAEAAEAKRKAEQDAAAKAARKSAVSPRSASPAAGQVDDTGSKKGRRATVADAVERHMGGGRV